MQRCGDCYFWMKSRDCPLERNVNGLSRGPSCNHPACGKFMTTSEAAAANAETPTAND